MAKHLPVFSRACGECTKCCEGWLEGVVHGHRMSRGCSCFYLEKTCQIYDARPDNPCKNYNCSWLNEGFLPAWMKPNLSNVIVTRRSAMVPTISGMTRIDYYDAIEAGGKIDSTALNWLVRWSVNSGTNLAYEVDGCVYTMGSQEFKDYLGVP